MADEHLVVDASALVDVLLGTPRAAGVGERISGRMLHAPAHLDAEVLSALGRLHRAGHLSARDVTRRLDLLADVPIERHDLPPLLDGAWRRRDRIRLVDGLYVELASVLDAPLITTDAALGRAARGAEVIS